MITKKNWLKKIPVDKETKFAGELIKLCNAEEIQVYYTMSETKAAVAERTKRSVRNRFYRYMKDNEYKYIHKLTHFASTQNFRKKCWTDLIPKIVRKSDFFPFCTAKHYENLGNSRYKNGNKVCILKYDSPFRKGYKPQCKQEVLKMF